MASIQGTYEHVTRVAQASTSDLAPLIHEELSPRNFPSNDNADDIFAQLGRLVESLEAPDNILPVETSNLAMDILKHVEDLLRPLLAHKFQVLTSPINKERAFKRV